MKQANKISGLWKKIGKNVPNRETTYPKQVPNSHPTPYIQNNQAFNNDLSFTNLHVSSIKSNRPNNDSGDHDDLLDESLWFTDQNCMEIDNNNKKEKLMMIGMDQERVQDGKNRSTKLKRLENIVLNYLGSLKEQHEKLRKQMWQEMNMFKKLINQSNQLYIEIQTGLVSSQTIIDNLTKKNQNLQSSVKMLTRQLDILTYKLKQQQKSNSLLEIYIDSQLQKKMNTIKTQRYHLNQSVTLKQDKSCSSYQLNTYNIRQNTYNIRQNTQNIRQKHSINYLQSLQQCQSATYKLQLPKVKKQKKQNICDLGNNQINYKHNIDNTDKTRNIMISSVEDRLHGLKKEINYQINQLKYE